MIEDVMVEVKKSAAVLLLIEMNKKSTRLDD